MSVFVIGVDGGGTLARAVAEAYFKSREALGFPMLERCQAPTTVPGTAGVAK